MGDPKATSSSPPQQPQPSSSSSLSLPPGCRFYPSEEQLLSYYLHRKNNPSVGGGGGGVLYDVIQEINLYNFNPFELPEVTCFRFGYRGRKRHWYCYTALIGGGEEERERRRAGFGFWKRKGRVRDVTCKGGKRVLGRRKCFIFYLDKCKGSKSVKTDWLMYEYALLDNLKASFVVCRVFVKSRYQNSISELALSSCGEESVATVRHIGIQHDGSDLCLPDEDKAHQDTANEITVGEATRLEVEPNTLGTSLGLAGSSSLLVDSVTARHLVSILEGDFLELDDLV